MKLILFRWHRVNYAHPTTYEYSYQSHQTPSLVPGSCVFQAVSSTLLSKDGWPPSCFSREHTQQNSVLIRNHNTTLCAPASPVHVHPILVRVFGRTRHRTTLWVVCRSTTNYARSFRHMEASGVEPLLLSYKDSRVTSSRMPPYIYLHQLLSFSPPHFKNFDLRQYHQVCTCVRCILLSLTCPRCSSDQSDLLPPVSCQYIPHHARSLHPCTHQTLHS